MTPFRARVEGGARRSLAPAMGQSEGSSLSDFASPRSRDII